MRSALFAFLALVMFAFATPAMAQSNVSLTPAQQKMIDDQVAQFKAENAGTSTKQTLQTASEWANIGHTIGTALATTARELGVAANEFAKTPVGILAVGVIVWKFIGDELFSKFIHIMGGIAWFGVMIPIWFYFYRRARIKFITMKPVELPKLFGDGTRTKLVKYVEYDDSDYGSVTQAMYWLALAAITIVGMATTFSGW